MRTTLSLDDDVAAALERLRQRRDASFKDIVNEALRLGVRQMTRRSTDRVPFATNAVDLGRPLITDLDDIGSVLASVEGDGFR